MQVTETTEIRTLLRRFPTAADMFGWYGIELDRIDRETTVRDIAWANRLELDDLIADLQASVDDELRERDSDDDEDYDEEEDEDTLDDVGEAQASEWPHPPSGMSSLSFGDDESEDSDG